jgi:alpha-L-fucosidase 2
MDIAAVRELLTNLLEGAEHTGMYAEKQDKWKEMLALLPEYRCNEDGSLKEWADDFYTDQNSHRHHSHLYGLFPGHSVVPGSKEYDAFRLAEEKRLTGGLKAQSSWSAVYMAGVNARIGNGDISWLALSEMVRNCCMGNLFTVHNDWRRTGSVSCDDFRVAPFQIDGNIGFPAVVNEMLVQSASGDIVLLPALPQKWKSGHLSGIRTVGGHQVSVRWNGNTAEAEILCGFAENIVLLCGYGWTFADGTVLKSLSAAPEKTISVTLYR